MAVDADRTYTETEHVALVADAVKRENASLAEDKAGLETQVSELAGKVEVLEAEKATLSSELESEKKAHSDFKVEVERAQQIEALKTERAQAVKTANPALPDTHFTPERILAWAELDEATFTNVVLDGIKAIAGVKSDVRETAAFKTGQEAGTTLEGQRPTARFLSVGREN